MGGECGMYGRRGEVRAGFWCGQLTKTLLKPTCRWKDNIKMDRKNRTAGSGLD